MTNDRKPIDAQTPDEESEQSSNDDEARNETSPGHAKVINI